MRAAEILTAVPDLPPEFRAAIQDLDARAYQSNTEVRYNESQTYMRLMGGIKAAGSESAFARKASIAKQSLADILSGKRPMSPRAEGHWPAKGRDESLCADRPLERDTDDED